MGCGTGQNGAVRKAGLGWSGDEAGQPKGPAGIGSLGRGALGELPQPTRPCESHHIHGYVESLRHLGVINVEEELRRRGFFQKGSNEG